MDNGGTKPDDNTMPDGDNFELEVSDKDTELLNADIESPGDDVDQLPVDDTELVMGDMPEPDDPADKPTDEKKPEEEPKDEAPAEEEKPEAEDFDDENLDNELDELEAEEKADEESENTTVADEEKPEEAEPAEEDKTEEPTEEEKPEEEPKDEAPAEEEKPEAEEEPKDEEPVEAAPVDEEHEDEAPANEEKPEEEPKDEAPAEEEPTEEEKPEEEPKDEEHDEPVEDKSEDETPIVVDGQNAPVDSTQANSAFPVSPAKETKDNRSKIGLFVMIAVIVLLLLGCGIYVLINGNKKPGGNGGNGGGNGDEDNPPSKVEGMTEFDVQLLKDFAEEDNVVYSPMSIKYAMSMLADGADGNTKKEITDVIGTYNPKDYTNSDHLSIANALFVRDDFKNLVKTSYTDAIKEKYGANTIYDPFNNAASINDWVYENTMSLIPKIVEDGDLNEAVFVIANTVAIDMEWDNVIQCTSFPTTHMDCLNDEKYGVEYAHENYSDYIAEYDDSSRSKVNLNGKDVLGMEFGASINNYDIIKELGEDKIRNTVKAAYEKCLAEKKYEYECMIGDDSIDEYLDNYIDAISKNYGSADASTGFLMYAGNDVKMFAKNFKEYDGTTLQYVGIMPTNETLSDFIEDTSLENLKTLIGSLKEIKEENFDEGKVTRVHGVVPEYDYNKDFTLIEEFNKLGVEEAFTTDANLSKMLEDDAKGVAISKINHSAKIQFTNFGVKAAAATAVIGAGAALGEFDYLFDVPVEEIDLTFDKPFLYLIRDTETGEIWFMGTVYEGKEYTNNSAK